MPDRVEKRPLPEVELVDMRQEFQETGSENVVSRKLIEEIRLRLERKEQAMVLLNRRGYSPVVLCRTCGKTLGAGAKALRAYYNGDATYATSTSSSYTLTISKAATATSLAAAPNPAASGTTVTFTAVVTSSLGMPTGTVSFKQGTLTLGTVTLDATGTAAFSTSTLSVGLHVVKAYYNTSTNYAASSSATVTEIVQ